MPNAKSPAGPASPVRARHDAVREQEGFDELSSDRGEPVDGAKPAARSGVTPDGVPRDPAANARHADRGAQVKSGEGKAGRGRKR